MAFKIGFASEFLENKRMESKSAVPEPAAAPRRSMVQVYFAERNMIWPITTTSLTCIAAIRSM